MLKPFIEIYFTWQFPIVFFIKTKRLSFAAYTLKCLTNSYRAWNFPIYSNMTMQYSVFRVNCVVNVPHKPKWNRRTEKQTKNANDDYHKATILRKQFHETLDFHRRFAENPLVISWCGQTVATIDVSPSNIAKPTMKANAKMHLFVLWRNGPSKRGFTKDKRNF